MPIKGGEYNKAIDHLRRLGIGAKCKEKGWNDWSDRILQKLQVPFQSFTPPQSRIVFGTPFNLDNNGLIKIKLDVKCISRRDFCK